MAGRESTESMLRVEADTGLGKFGANVRYLEPAKAGFGGSYADGRPHPRQTAGSSRQASRLGCYCAGVIHEVSGG